MELREPKFSIDEGPLREAVLKAYHEKRGASPENQALVAAVRQFLSGPPGGESAPGSYFFELDPPRSVREFLAELDRSAPDLARRTAESVVRAAREAERKGARELAPNPAVWAASIAGSLAVKAGLDETVACALVAATILAVARLGAAVFEEALAERGPRRSKEA